MIASAQRRKLVGILGRLSSDFDGERAAAGLLATRLIRAAGLSWDELLVGGAPPRLAPALRPRSQRQAPVFDQQRAAAVEMCRHYAEHLTTWEVEFLAGIARRRTLSVKQLAVLTGIATELAKRRKA